MSDEQSNGLEALSAGASAVVDIDSIVPKILIVSAGFVNNRRVKVALAVGAAAYTLGEKAWHYNKRRLAGKTYRIKVNEKDPLYDVLQKWLIDSLPVEDQKNVVAASVRRNKQMGEVNSSFATGYLDLFYDGSREQDIKIGGHLVTVSMDQENDMESATSGKKKSLLSNNIIIECSDFAARSAVLKTLKEEAAKLTERRPTFRTAQKWGSFRVNSDIPNRPIETVVLKKGQADRVLGDLKAFLTHEEDYVRIGIPYRRGLLLSGLPGTGKTSIAAALAHELNLDVYYIALSSVEDDATLIELLSDVRERSVLLLEDVDVAHATKERTDDGGGVTMSGLLNALDGFTTPHGLITIMTTNHLEVLDPALVRPGRIDIVENISAVDSYQVEGLCQQFLGYVPEGLPPVREEDGIISARIIEVFKQHLRDKEGAGPALVDFLIGALKEPVVVDKVDTPVKSKTKTKKRPQPVARVRAVANN